MFFKKSFWTTRNVIFIIFIIAMLCIIPKISSILMLFFGAYVIACALNPYICKLQAKMNRNLATVAVLSISGLTILALILPIFFIAFNEISHFITTFPNKLTHISNFILNGEVYGYKIQNLIDINQLIGSSTTFAQNILSKSLNFTLALTQVIVIVVAMTMIVYYIAVDLEYIKKKFVQFFPPELKLKTESIIVAISYKVGAYVRAQLISLAAVGIMVMILLMILRVEYATLLGVISGVLDIIPILGPAIALLLILLVVCPATHLKVILIICGFLLCQQLSNYAVKPFLFGKMMQIHPLTVFLALFLASQLLGFWGVILSHAIATTICILIDEIYLKPMNVKGRNFDEN